MRVENSNLIGRKERFVRVRDAGRATTSNLAFPAGGIRRPHPRLVIGGRGCGSAWSLSDIMSPLHPPGNSGVEILKMNRNDIFYSKLKNQRIKSSNPNFRFLLKRNFFLTGDINFIFARGPDRHPLPFRRNERC